VAVLTGLFKLVRTKPTETSYNSNDSMIKKYWEFRKVVERYLIFNSLQPDPDIVSTQRKLNFVLVLAV
jgi:hypothetical protein